MKRKQPRMLIHTRLSSGKMQSVQLATTTIIVDATITVKATIVLSVLVATTTIPVRTLAKDHPNVNAHIPNPVKPVAHVLIIRLLIALPHRHREMNIQQTKRGRLN